jgi:hypothetical protein
MPRSSKPNVKFASGQTALDYARERDWGAFPEIASILEKAVAK